MDHPPDDDATPTTTQTHHDALSGGPHARGRVTLAEWMLLVATAIWGLSFALAKTLGNAANEAAGLPLTNSFGQFATLAVRFGVAAIVWCAVFRGARSGWTREHFRYGSVVGLLLGVGLALQHAGLARVSEAVTAFLTSLAIIFVAAIMWIFFKKRPTIALLLAILLAIPGAVLVNGGEVSASLNLGSLLVLLSAFVFAWHLISLNLAAPRVEPLKLLAIQFACASIACGLATLAFLPPTLNATSLLRWDLLGYLALLIAGPTFVSFGLMTFFQPSVSPGRAALIYLLEPVFAALFAWLINGSPITGMMLAGGSLILAANGLVEWMDRRRDAPAA
jgi:drug/metabolite transporter (DMT)-like permease